MRSFPVLLVLSLVLAGCSGPGEVESAPNAPTSSSSSSMPANETMQVGLCDDPIVVAAEQDFSASIERTTGLICIELPGNHNSIGISQSFPTPESFVAILPYGPMECRIDFHLGAQTQVFEQGFRLSNLLDQPGKFLVILGAASLDLNIRYGGGEQGPVRIDRSDLVPHAWGYDVVSLEGKGDPNGYRIQMDTEGPAFVRGLGLIGGQPPQLQPRYTLSITDQGRSCAELTTEATLHFGSPFSISVGARIPAGGAFVNEGTYTATEGPELLNSVQRLIPPTDRLEEFGFR